MKRWYVLAPLAGVAAAAGAFAFGVQSWRPILIGVVITSLLLWARRYWPEGTYLAWPLAGNRLRGGGSHQVTRLARTIAGQATRHDTTDPGLQYRLRKLAAARLHRLGVQWDDPRAARMLGADVHEALTTEQFRPGLNGVEVIIDAIERLDTSPTPSGTRPRVRA
ncbi:hypothetical protein G1H11_23115 [Phytoactinopolyspora alkaliphila]|uniref:Uncharacterized protein n=1 Tax=Phytoactinopolyspora alkaliphila TaxID=1783498 RepID=A0A6N9YTA1_9ACTN|nr:hypothetical protein [Phytoactinopolyspora alkaliphila]NED98195.1 hypothetical protein [Phytoactinopolyspora alkaliphila]